MATTQRSRPVARFWLWNLNRHLRRPRPISCGILGLPPHPKTIRMTHDSLHPVDRDPVEDLNNRAAELIDRRDMLASTGRKLALPILVTYVCSANAMGQTGSGGAAVTDDARSVAPAKGRHRRSRRIRD